MSRLLLIALAIIFAFVCLTSAGDLKVQVWEEHHNVNKLITITNITLRNLDTNQIYPQNDYWDLTTGQIQVFSNLPIGSYAVLIYAFGYYNFNGTVDIAGTGEVTYAVYMVPTYDGLTISYYGPEFVVWPHWNVTIPAGYTRKPNSITNTILPVPHVDSSTKHSHIFAAARPPPLIHAKSKIIRLNHVLPGTYEFRLEFESSWVSKWNFSNVPITVRVFQGMSPDGLIGEWRTSTALDVPNWYFANIVVTGSGNCRSYSLAFKDGYSTERVSDAQAPTKVTIPNIYQKCTNSPDCNRVVHGDDVTTKECGAFGDPHVIMFNGTGVTCGSPGRMLLVDNPYYSLWTDNRMLLSGTKSTAIAVVILRYKVCNPIELVIWGDASDDIIYNAPSNGVHGIRKDGKYLYMDAIHTKIRIDRIDGYYTVAVSTPAELAIGGVCGSACPPGTSIPTNGALPTKKDGKTVDEAKALCQSHGLTDFEYLACMYDVINTQNDNFAQHGSNIKSSRTDVATPWEAQINLVPFADGGNPSDENGPSGDGFSLLPAVVMALSLTIAVALL